MCVREREREAHLTICQFHEGYLIFPESTLGRIEFVLTIPFRVGFALTGEERKREEREREKGREGEKERGRWE